MRDNAAEIVNEFFFAGAGAPAESEVRIDVLDSWIMSDLSAVSPTTISWSAGKTDTGR